MDNQGIHSKDDQMQENENMTASCAREVQKEFYWIKYMRVSY